MEAFRRVSESGRQTTRAWSPGAEASERSAGTLPPVQGLIEQSGAGSGQYAERSTCAEAATGASADTAKIAATQARLTIVPLLTLTAPLGACDRGNSVARRA